MNKGLLDEEQQEYYAEHFGSAVLTCDDCKQLQSTDTRTRTKTKRCSHRLNRWAPWQTSCQSTVLFGHSSTTHRFCRLMESADNFRTESNVQENEKKLAKCLKRSDLPTNNNKKISTKSTKKPQTAAKQTGKDFRRNFLNKQTHRDSSDSDFDDKQVTIRTPLAKLSEAEEAALKPCSFEKLVAKVERDSSGKRSNKRVRLTKLPKIEKIDLDVSGIQDNQLDFCSQVTMPTLFNRCQVKRKRDSMRALFGDGFDEEEEDEMEVKEESPLCQPSVKRARYDEIKVVDTESGYDDEGFDFPNNIEEPYYQEAHKNSSDTGVNALNCDVSDEDENVIEPKRDLLDELNNVNKNESDREHDDIETQPFLPFSTQTLHHKHKPSPALETKSAAEETVPEAPLDIDLSSFLFDTSPGKEKYENENISNHAATVDKNESHTLNNRDRDNTEIKQIERCALNNGEDKIKGQKLKMGHEEDDHFTEKDELKDDRKKTCDDSNLMGDSLLNLFDDDDDNDDFMDDLPQSPTIVSQVTTLRELPDKQEIREIPDDFFSSPPIIRQAKKNMNVKSQIGEPLQHDDVVDSPLFAKPKNKSKKNCIIDTQQSPAPALKSPISVSDDPDDSHNDEFEGFFAAPKSESKNHFAPFCLTKMK